MFASSGLFRNVFFQQYNDRGGNTKFQDAAKDSKHLVQRFSLEKVLETHQGCVNSVHWNDTGSLLLTAGDDKNLVVTNPFSYKVLENYKTKHRTNILCAKFLPTTNNRIISCSGDGSILNLDLDRLLHTEWNFFTCHCRSCYELETIPGEPNTYLSCSEDRTVRQYDLRSSVQCSKESCFEHLLINCGKPVSTIAINPIKPYQLAIATVDSMVRIVDRRKIITQNPTQKIVPECSFTVPHLNHRSYRITSLSYSPDGRDILASYSNEEVYLFSLDIDPNVIEVANDFLVNAPNPPRYRRIRLRGDWADTGPLSRPSTESQIRSSISSIVMTQMSDMLTHVFNTPSLGTTAVQDFLGRPNYSPVYPLIGRRISSNNTIEFVDEPPADAGSTQDDNHIEESVASNSDIEGATKQIKSKKRKPSSRFDDFVPLQKIKAQYKGHRNARTLIKEATFWGNDYILSGSDCGHVFIWDRHTCEIVQLLSADSHVVNCIQPHPSRPILATSGVDHNVKLWSPLSVDNNFSESFANKLVERNKLMIEESRDTVTVSPTLIVSMLAHFHELRRQMHSRHTDPQIQEGYGSNPRRILDHRFGNQVPGLESTESNEEQNSDSSTEDEI